MRQSFSHSSCSLRKSLFPEVVDIPVVAQMQIPLVLSIEFLQLQYIDKVVDVVMHVLQFSSADVGETAELPQLQLVEFWTVVACPLCATTGAVLSITWRSSSKVVDVAVLPQRQVPAVGFDSWDEGWTFLGPCTQVQGREPCPQGHGSHN